MTASTSPARLPGPARSRTLAAVSQNAECERCHAQQAAEWRGSMHQRAHTDPVYQRAFAIEPMAFCQSCHAPESAPTGTVAPAVGELGVGCVTCHLSGDVVLAVPREGAAAAPHAVQPDARFASDGGCAGCHEFAFPMPRIEGGVQLMQSTVSEHARSPLHATPCAGCHMPARDAASGHRDHRFAAARNGASLRRALRVSAERASPTSVTLTLRLSGMGHAFPTGDLFRRLELVAEGAGPDHSLQGRAVRYLTRHFERETRLPALRAPVLRSDDRVGADGASERVVTLELGAAARGLAIEWRVAYQRVEHPVASGDESAVVAETIEIARGVVEP